MMVEGETRVTRTVMTKLAGWLACCGAVLLLVAAMVSGVSSANAAPAVGALRIEAAWVRLAAVPGRPAAGYFTLRGGTKDAELVSVASPLARIEMHSMSMAGGVMRMDRLPSARVTAGATTRFAPGGNHLMLFDVPASVRPGAMLPLVFRFADGRVIRVEARAQAPGTTAPMDHAAH